MIIKNYFLKSTTNLIIPYISSYVVEENKSIVCTINGHKKIDIVISQSETYNQKDVDYLYKIFNWAYSGENTDKISILRNLITIFLCEDCGSDYYSLILMKSKEIYSTAIKNFDIYFKENVEQYFNARQKMMELIDNKSNEISEQISHTINSMNKTLIAFLGTIFTSIISFIQNANGNLIQFLLISFISYQIIYGCYYLSFSKIKIKSIEDSYKKDIKKNK